MDGEEPLPGILVFIGILKAMFPKIMQIYIVRSIYVQKTLKQICIYFERLGNAIVVVNPLFIMHPIIHLLSKYVRYHRLDRGICPERRLWKLGRMNFLK